METRLTTLKKRKAEENMKNQVSQEQMFKLCNHEVGPRDIVIGEDQSLNTNGDFSIKKEIKIESGVESEIVPSGVVLKESTIKVEIKEETAVVTEEEMICDDFINPHTNYDVNLDISDQCNTQEYSENFEISTNSELSYIEDVTHQNTDLKENIETEKRQQTTSDESDTDATHQAQLVMETQHLDNILPRKIWTRIVDNLEDSDFLSLTNSSPFIRTLLSKERIYSLYKLVFEIAVLNLAGDSEVQIKTEAKSFLLQSRLVCKEWKTVVDTVVSNWFVNNREHLSQPAKRLSDWLCEIYTFKGRSERFNKFAESFKKTYSSPIDNPFVGRYIKILTGFIGDAHEFEWDHARMSCLLDTYGFHIWSCEINIFNTHALESGTYQRIVDCLYKLPKLKNLKINYEGDKSRKNWIGDDIHPNTKHLMRLRMENLRTLELRSVCSFFSRKIFNRSPNLAYLTVDRKFLRDPKCFPYLKLRPVLETLKICVYIPNDLKDVIYSYYPLKILNLKCCSSLISDWSKFLENISKFLWRLRVLQLHNLNYETHYNSILPYPLNGRLDLFYLKTFYLEIYSIVSLDFLLLTRCSLEEISIKICSVNLYGKTNEQFLAMEKDQIIQFLGYEGKLLESNIWRLLPKLKKVSVELYSFKLDYKREQWMKKMKNLGS